MSYMFYNIKPNSVSREIMGASSISLILSVLKEGDSYGHEWKEKKLIIKKKERSVVLFKQEFNN
ncbi:MAG: hypothetical protein HQ521_12930 [Bacteroidetes bacterium]|nr:hypothetical protein [Bacteroidota bacterium]